MSTAEDVFYLYEHKSCYYDCSQNEKSVCYCRIEQIVQPITIGDQDIPCEYNIKCYIRPGHDCPICFEQILTKTSAFITCCGHAFHKKCIFKYMKTKWLSSSYMSVARCPMCRCSLGHPEFIQRYKSSYFNGSYKNNNKLDKLEDFWISCDYKLPLFCSNGYDHYLGIKKICFCCEAYREKGEIY